MSGLNLAIVGMGNVGWNIANQISQSEHSLAQIVTNKDYEELSLSSETEVLRSSSAIHDVDIVLICVPDDAVNKVISEINTNLAIAHTSGSTPLSEGRSKSGVFYPFQTFTLNVPVSWKEIPIFIESNDEELETKLKQLGSSFSERVEHKNSSERRAIHMAGVFGANFVNHILDLAETIAQQGNEDISVLRPLLDEVIRKAVEMGPRSSQTGPARRGDRKLIEEHISSLTNQDPRIASIYEMLSESIIKTYGS